MSWIVANGSTGRKYDLYKQDKTYHCGVAAAATALYICRYTRMSANDILEAARRAEPKRYEDHMTGDNPAGMNMDLIMGALRGFGLQISVSEDEGDGALPRLEQACCFKEFRCIVMHVEQQQTDLTHFVVIAPGAKGPAVLCPSGKVFDSITLTGGNPSYLTTAGNSFFTDDYAALK